MKKRTLKRLSRRLKIKRRTSPGAAPGTLMAQPGAPNPILSVFAFGPSGLEEHTIREISEVKPLLERSRVAWVNVDGLGDVEMLRSIGEYFKIHPLALEDVVNTHQRPKVEPFDEHLFIVVREITLAERLENDQLSIFLGKNYVLSFQERAGDCFDAVRARLRDPQARFRSHGPDYLAYALIDATVDSYFPIVEKLGDELETIEDKVLTEPCQKEISKLHDIKRSLFQVRRAAWPLREALNAIIRDSSPLVSNDTRMYLRDCVDHTVQILDLVETDREVCSDLMDVYLSSVSNKMNQVMKVLTIISTIFIPLTFLAGVYGMNFHTDVGNMPELSWPNGYAIFWIISGAIALGLLGLFAWLGWLRGNGK